MCCEDVFLSDPLLPRGQRVPLYLSEAPQQVSTLPTLASPQPSCRAWKETLPLHLSSGDGLSEAAAPASYHVPSGLPHPVPWLLHCLAQWARADRPYRPPADEPGRAKTQLFWLLHGSHAL